MFGICAIAAVLLVTVILRLVSVLQASEETMLMCKLNPSGTTCCVHAVLTETSENIPFMQHPVQYSNCKNIQYSNCMNCPLLLLTYFTL